jgi:Ala-tRNA(Pro) deacylase
MNSLQCVFRRHVLLKKVNLRDSTMREEGGIMPATRLKNLLDKHQIPYRTMHHVRTITAQETAQMIHIKGRMMAKTVIVVVRGQLCMAVLPAHEHTDLDQLKALCSTDDVRVAHEHEFKNRFEDCEVGAMPPFGELYGMGVFVHADLAAAPEIAFNAGTHDEVIFMAYKDFDDLIKPNIAPIAVESTA